MTYLSLFSLTLKLLITSYFVSEDQTLYLSPTFHFTSDTKPNLIEQPKGIVLTERKLRQSKQPYGTKLGNCHIRKKAKKKKKELLITFFNIASRGTFIQCQNRGAISGADETFRHFRLTHVTIGTEKREKSDKYERKRERSCSVYAIFDHHHKI